MLLSKEILTTRLSLSPQVSVQRSQALAEVEAQSDVLRRRQFRTADEDPRSSMIYYDNDQFCGEDIYYLSGEREREEKSCLHRSALDSPVINQTPWL